MHVLEIFSLHAEESIFLYICVDLLLASQSLNILQKKSQARQGKNDDTGYPDLQ